jgi:parallel beta-helix repeat protein
MIGIIKRTVLFMIICIFISSGNYLNIDIVGADSPNTYYVANDGSDSNNGLSTSTPWRTIGKVNSELNGGVISPGDNIYFKRGDTFTDTYINVQISGAGIDSPLVFGAYGTGNKPVISDKSYGFYIVGRDYITIQDIKIEDVSKQCIRIEGGCSYITIDNCEWYNSSSTAGCFVYNGCDHIILRNCTANSCYGDTVCFFQNIDYILVEGCTFAGGGASTHTALQIRGRPESATSSHSVIRNNVIYNGADQNLELLQCVDYALIENNMVYGSGRGIKLDGTWNNIIRNNIVYNHDTFGIQIYTNVNSGYTSYGVDNAIYHNTIYNSGSGNSMDAGLRFFRYGGSSPGGIIQDNVVKNNIIYKASWSGLGGIIYSDADTGFDDGVTNNLFDNNILFDNTVGQSNIIDYAYGVYGDYSVAGAESALPQFFEDNMQVNPLLTNPNNADFSLQISSPAIDAGEWFTTTNGGGTGTTITVDEANYFFAGMSFVNIEGDNIFVGDDTNLIVTSVNYNANTITLNREITWSDGDYVSLSDYSGSAPDIGAIEFASSGSDATPNADYTWSDADGAGTGTIINFDASSSTDDNGITLYEWDWNNDGTYDYSSSTPTANHDYGNTNSYDCKLRVTDTNSQTDTFTDSVQANVDINVDIPPNADYTWSDADGAGTGTIINFDASSSTDDNGITLYEWDWNNDGTYDCSSGTPTANHDYGNTNSYDCKLRVTDTNSQTDTFTDSVQANVDIGNNKHNTHNI